MKKLQNCLFITRQGVYVHKERETVVIHQDKEKLLQLPVHGINQIVCFGNVLVSPFLVGFCGENGVGLAFFTEYGKFLGRLQGRQTGNIALRKAQYKHSELAPQEVARVIVAAKVANSKAILQRHIRNYGANELVEQVISNLGQRLEQIKVQKDIEKIRGLEGDSAAQYFGVFNHLIAAGVNEDFQFVKRSRRPPTDRINAMMSFAYSILGNEIASALQGVGLDSQAGFLHADRPGRESLAQDILEEFRSWWADRFVLSLINRKQIQANGFEEQVSGAVVMKDATRKTFLQAWQEKKQEEILHPYIQEKVPIGLLPHIQSMLLARYLRGDLDIYPPFIAK